MAEDRRRAENAVKVSYDRLAGNPAEGKKGIDGFNLTMEQYRDLPLSAKIGLIPAELGIKMEKEDVEAIIENAKNPTGLSRLISALGGGVVGAVANAAKNIFTGIGEALNFESADRTVQQVIDSDSDSLMNRVDRFLLGVTKDTNKESPTFGKDMVNTADKGRVSVDSDEGKAALERIEQNRERVRKEALQNHLREVEKITGDPIRRAEEESQNPGDLDTVAEVQAFEERMADAREEAGKSRSPFGGGSNAPQQATSGFGFGFEKGGLASKPKAKPKRKKNTKGLGTKPKAT